MSGFVLRTLRIAVYFVVTLPAMPVQAFLLAIKSPKARRFPLLYHRAICRLLGIHLVRRGTISTHRDTISALSSAPRTFVVPAASAAAAPVVHFKVINNHPTAQVKEGQSKRNSDGSYSLEAVVSQIEDQMADNIHRGTSPVAHMLEQTHGLERRPAG